VKRLLLVAVLGVITCAPPPTLPPVQPVGISAPFSKTWDAVIDILSEQNIPVKTIDRSSGFAAAELATVDSDTMNHLADCGSQLKKFMVGFTGIARYNVVVRGDSTTSTVKVTAKFVSNHGDCSSRNVFENDFQGAVKARAEGR
jgi:hypothetical protein